MNRLDRLYALVEELRAAGSPGRSARRLAEHFEVSVRTIERDILALQEAGVPISAQLGRRGGYVLDRSMTLPPLNFTPDEAVAMAVGLRRLDDTPWGRDARTALLKVVAAMPESAATRARALADGVRLLVQPLSPPNQAIADALVRAIEDATPIRIAYLDVGGRPTVREVEPHHVVLGPNGSYVTGWCRMRQDERVFRIDRIRSLEPVPGAFHQPVREFDIEDYEIRTPAWEWIATSTTNTDTPLSPGTCTLGAMTNSFTPNTLAWFEVATDDPDTATSFYGDLFGWAFSPFADPETTGMDYRVAALQSGGAPFGGVVATGGAQPGHAVFYIAVTDVAATCETAERLGGKVVSKELVPPAGPPFAYLRDPVGSLFGVFTPPA